MGRAGLVILLVGGLLCAPALAGDAGEKSEKKSCPGTMEECLTSMIERYKKAGLIGLDGEWDEEVGGYRIQTFLEASMAESAGIKVGDTLTRINGIPLTDEKASKADAVNRRPGNEVTVTILRDGQPHTFHVVLIPVPADVMAREIGRHMMESHAPEAAAKRN